MVEEINIRAPIMKAPIYFIVCPHCGGHIFEEGMCTLHDYRKHFENTACPDCLKTVNLGNVELW
jgi:hypothetical protein